jgi:hypothetical protein
MRRIAILLFFLTLFCVWNLYPPWLVELSEPIPSEADPTGFTFRTVEHHPIFWNPDPLPDAATSKLVLPTEDDPSRMSMDYRQSHIHWRYLLKGNVLLLGAMILALFLQGRLSQPPRPESATEGD